MHPHLPVLLELPTNLHDFVQLPEKAPTRALSLLKVPTSAFTIKNLLTHYARRAIKHGK